MEYVLGLPRQPSCCEAWNGQLHLASKTGCPSRDRTASHRTLPISQPPLSVQPPSGSRARAVRVVLTGASGVLGANGHHLPQDLRIVGNELVRTDPSK